MSTYNGAAFLQKQLDSLASQSFLPYELQIGDDGSSDETFAIVEAFRSRAGFPVHLHRNPQNLGFGENFIQTALRCSGDWIAFCDQDDVWMPEKLERCAREIEGGGSDLCLIVHDATVTAEDLTPIRRLYGYPKRRLARRLETDPDWHCVGFTQTVRADLLREVPTSPRPSVPWHPWRDAHDLWAAVLSNTVGSILFLGAPLALYRRHGATVTDAGDGEQLLSRIGASVRANGESYARRAGYLRTIAENLRGNSAGASEKFAGRMQSAAGEIEALAERLTRRGAIYESRTRRAGAREMVHLARAGGYWGKAWPFGARALLKDIMLLLLPRREPAR